MKNSLKKFVVMHVNYFRKILFELGWEPRKSDKHTDALLRGFVISVLGKMDDEEVTQEALCRYSKFLKSPSSLSPDLIEPICSIAAWNGNTKTYAELGKAVQKCQDYGRKTYAFLGSMCGFKEPKLLLKVTRFFSNLRGSLSKHATTNYESCCKPIRQKNFVAMAEEKLEENKQKSRTWKSIV